MRLPFPFIVLVSTITLCLVYVEPIKCNVGYGQRGKLRSYGYDWVMRAYVAIKRRLIRYSQENAQIPNIAGKQSQKTKKKW